LFPKACPQAPQQRTRLFASPLLLHARSGKTDPIAKEQFSCSEFFPAKETLSDTSMAFLTMVLNTSSAYLRNRLFCKVILRLNEALHQKITALTAMGRRLQADQAKLEQKVLKKTKELEEKNARLQVEMNTKGRIAREFGESELHRPSLFEHASLW
jgi:C4-dicarboxylate-specific signal transduction histidine kinase